MRLFSKENKQQGLERFIEAQKRDYQLALAEVRAGKKLNHWIWYIFPQMYGLGDSCYANLYGIRNREEAVGFLKTAEVAGFTVSSKEQRHYHLANIALVGEAITLAMRTAVKW